MSANVAPIRRRNVFEKAARIVTEQRIHDVPVAHVFEVAGDTNPKPHLVTVVAEHRSRTGLVPPLWSCTCRWARSTDVNGAAHAEPCSHVLAAKAILAERDRPSDPFAGIGFNK